MSAGHTANEAPDALLDNVVRRRRSGVAAGGGGGAESFGDETFGTAGRCLRTPLEGRGTCAVGSPVFTDRGLSNNHVPTDGRTVGLQLVGVEVACSGMAVSTSSD